MPLQSRSREVPTSPVSLLLPSSPSWGKLCAFFAARYRRWHLANTTQDAAFLRQRHQGPENPCSIQRMSCGTEQMDPSKHRRAPMLWHKEKCRQYLFLFFCLLELERLWLNYYRLLYQSIQSGASPFQQNALNSRGEQLERNPGRGRDSKPICAQLRQRGAARAHVSPRRGPAGRGATSVLCRLLPPQGNTFNWRVGITEKFRGLWWSTPLWALQKWSKAGWRPRQTAWDSWKLEENLGSSINTSWPNESLAMHKLLRIVLKYDKQTSKTEEVSRCH